MAATQSSPAQQQGFQSTFINRVVQVPLVSDALNTAYFVINSNSYSAYVASLSSSFGHAAVKRTEGLQARLDPQLRSIDATLSKGFDYVQTKYPYPFETKSDEMIAKARAPADQVYVTAENHLKLMREKSDNLHQQLANVAGANIARVQEASSAILREIDGLLNKFRSHELPANVRDIISPFASHLSASYGEIRQITQNPELSSLAKAQSVLAYSRQEATPIIHEVVATLRALLNQTKEAVPGQSPEPTTSSTQ